MLATTTAVADPELKRRLGRVRLYVITSALQSAERTEEVVKAACAGGAEIVQLRRKNDTGLDAFRLAERCRRIAGDAGVLFIVNDRLDIAMGVDADGVHLGQDDLPLAVARRLWPGRIAGLSTHSPEQAMRAVVAGADYIGVGPVHATPTKPGRDATGLKFVTAVAESVAIPWVAIGGIDEETLGTVLDAGAPAVAVVRAVSDAADPETAVRRMHARVPAARGAAS